MLLLCNNRSALINVIDNAKLQHNKISEQRVVNMLKQNDFSWSSMKEMPLWQELSQSNTQLLARVN